MSKGKYPETPQQEVEIKTVDKTLESLSGTLENWIHCRQERMNSQFRLIESCRSESEITHYKGEGLLDFKGTVIVF